MKKPHTVKELAMLLKTTAKGVHTLIDEVVNNGFCILVNKKVVSISKDRATPTLYTKNNKIKLGISGDQHICSDSHRPDVMYDLFNWFAEEQVDAIFNTGNFIDGFLQKLNGTTCKTVTIDDQIKKLFNEYPAISIPNYTIWGDCHEGWYGKNGMDVGKYIETYFRDNGRLDWINVGHLFGNVHITNPETNHTINATMFHPGGGTAYAISYKPQKIVEGFGSNKPDLLLIGHYHKLSYNLINEVHTIQTGCTQDKSDFTLKHLIEPHIGGWIVELTIDDCLSKVSMEMKRYPSSTFWK